MGWRLPVGCEVQLNNPLAWVLLLDSPIVAFELVRVFPATNLVLDDDRKLVLLVHH